MGVGFAITASRPRLVSRCHSATSLPTPSPSAFTCVVNATRRPGVSTPATSCAARTRSGGMDTPLVVMSSKLNMKTSRRGVARTASRNSVALRHHAGPDERELLSAHRTAHVKRVDCNTVRADELGPRHGAGQHNGDPIRVRDRVRAAVGGGSAGQGDVGGEVSGRDTDGAAGARDIGLHSFAERLEVVRAGQGGRADDSAGVRVLLKCLYTQTTTMIY